MKKPLFVTLLACVSVVAHAKELSLRFFGSMGYGVGGDTLASGNYTDGSSYEVKAGSGFQLAIGADFRVAENVTIQGSIGYHVHDATASNGQISFKRTPVELLGFYDITNQFRLGGGVRKVNDAELTVSGAAVGSTTAGKYDSSTGVVLEGQYFFSPVQSVAGNRKAQLGLSVRYVTETYTPKNGSTAAKNGNHGVVGLVVYY